MLFLPPWLIVAAGATITVSNWESALAGPITFSLWLYPLVISAGAVAAWVLFVNGLVGVARMVNLVPLPWVLSGGALLVAAAIT